MKVNKDDLLKNVKIADSIVNNKNTGTILSNCLFSVENNVLKICSTNNEISIKTQIDCISDVNESFLIDGKKLSGIISAMPKGEIELFSDKKNIIRIKHENVKGKYKLVSIEPDEFPVIQDFNNENSIEIEKSVLKNMIRKIQHAAALDVIKPVFNGIYFTQNADVITAVATDSRRLSIIKEKIDSETKIENGFIVPLKTINEMLKVLDSDGLCNISIVGNQFFFKSDNIEIVSRIVDGQYPNYKSIIPKEYTNKVIIEKEKLLNSIKRAMAITREPSFKIILHFEKNNLKINVATPEIGESEEYIEIQSESDSNITIGLNGQFLVGSIKDIESKFLKIGITGEMTPLCIMEKDNNNYMSIIMPIQIKQRDV